MAEPFYETSGDIDGYIDDYSADQSSDTYGIKSSGALDVLDRLSRIGLGVAGVFRPQQKLNQEIERQRVQKAAAPGSNTKLLWIVGAALLGVVLLMFALRK